MPAGLPDLRLRQGAGAAAADAQAGAAVGGRARPQPARRLVATPRGGQGLMSRSPTTIARKRRVARRRRARRRASTGRARSRAPFAGGVAWIVVVGALLAGIVAVNVLVLQLNMQFDGLSRERAQLKADNALLRSQLSSASANVRIEEAATPKLGLAGRRPADDDLRAARQRTVSDRRANHRIRLLLAAFALLFAVAIARAAWVQGAQHDRYTKMAITQHRETIEVPAGRGTIYDRTGEPLAIGEQATTVYADPRNIADAQRAAVVAGKTLGLDADALYPTLKDRSKGFVYVARKADPVKAAALSKQEIPGSASTPRSCARIRRERSPRTCSASPAPTTTASTGSSARSTRRSSGRPGFETIVKDPFGRAIDVVTSQRGAARQERDADDRPSDPGERGADPRAHREAVRRAWRGRDRDGSAHRRDPRDGELPDVRREPLRDRVPGRAPQPRRDRRLRARARRSRS